MKNKRSATGKKGFTLIELLVAATIIAVITAIGTVSYANTTRKSRDTKRIGDLEQIRTALEMYRADNGWYPNTGTGSPTAASDLATPLADYMPAIPSDPKSGAVSYQYRADIPQVIGATTRYFGYCISAQIEGTPPTSSCTITGRNYGVKNP